MEESNSIPAQKIHKEAPQLVTVLKEMKEGLDKVCAKVQALTAKVKDNHFPTSDGISYLEAKHLLLLNYCQSLVYYLLRKANGYSIEAHPVVRSLVEMRLFLEKIRPIDKKLQYQIQKLTRVTESTEEGPTENEKDTSQKSEDLLKYRPNPELLLTQKSTNTEEADNIYRPPHIAPAAMETDKVSKHERNAKRKEEQMLREANQNAYVRDIMNDLEDRPEEVREYFGGESREVTNFMAKLEERARQEEEQFTRAPLTKIEKQKMKHMKKTRNGLRGLTDSLFDDVKALEGDKPEESTGFEGFSNINQGAKRRKRRH